MVALSRRYLDTPEVLGRDTRQQIRRKACQLIGKAGLKPSDREDIEQELTLRLWQGLNGFDATLGASAAFVGTVLNRAANSVLRLRNSGKRGTRHVHQVTLPQYITPEEDSDDTDVGDEMGGVAASHEAAIDLAHDVAAVLNGLPPELRTLAEQLKTRCIAEIAHDWGVSRSTVYARVKELRAAFVAADLKEPTDQSGASPAFCEG